MDTLAQLRIQHAQREAAWRRALAAPQPRPGDYPDTLAWFDAVRAHMEAVHATHEAMGAIEGILRAAERAEKIASTGLRPGMRVQSMGRDGTIGALAKVGTVESLWVAERSYYGQPAGTVFAKVRIRGTWQRFGGGSGDSVVIRRADKWAPVPGSEKEAAAVQ